MSLFKKLLSNLLSLGLLLLVNCIQSTYSVTTYRMRNCLLDLLFVDGFISWLMMEPLQIIGCPKFYSSVKAFFLHC